MAWRWSGNKPLSKPMMVTLLTHICVTLPQWVKGWYILWEKWIVIVVLIFMFAWKLMLPWLPFVILEGNIFTGIPNQRLKINLDSKVHGAYMGPTWGRQDPGGPHVGPMILAIWAKTNATLGVTHNFVRRHFHLHSKSNMKDHLAKIKFLTRRTLQNLPLAW